MSRNAYLHHRLSSDQLRERFRNCRDSKESRRWQILWLVSLGHTLVEAASFAGFSYDYARHVLSQYNKLGIRSVQKKLIRTRKPGLSPLLSADQRRLLGRLLKGKAPDGGLWTGPKVAQWMSRQLGREIAPQRGWDYLKRLGYSLQAPRPRHVRASAVLQARFKKSFALKSKRGELKNLESD
jgi:transposase